MLEAGLLGRLPGLVLVLGLCPGRKVVEVDGDTLRQAGACCCGVAAAAAVQWL